MRRLSFTRFGEHSLREYPTNHAIPARRLLGTFVTPQDQHPSGVLLLPSCVLGGGARRVPASQQLWKVRDIVVPLAPPPEDMEPPAIKEQSFPPTRQASILARGETPGRQQLSDEERKVRVSRFEADVALY